MAYANFQGLIDSLHSGVSDTIEEAKNIIEINEKRQFVPKEFDTVIAYEGDINCQIITFKSIRYFDEHDLSACQNHEIRWKNLTSGIEGTSKLSVAAEYITETSFCAAWEIPPELCTQAGTIEISIAYYDKDGEVIVFSWNTGNYTGLSVGKSMDSVGFQFPAKNEMLVVSADTKNIVAPVGYNNIVGNFGESQIYNVYFLIDKYIGKNRSIDVENASIKLYIVIDNIMTAYDTNITKKLYTETFDSRNNDGLVLLTWPVPEKITNNSQAYAGPFSIALEISTTNEQDSSHKWLSNTYNQLTIGDSIIRNQVPVVPSDPDALQKTIFKSIDEYFTANDVTFFTEI